MVSTYTAPSGERYVNLLTPVRDESFNAVTGLNGSGKSNILDAICFVLGITNMQTVRAQNLVVSIHLFKSPHVSMQQKD